MRIMFILKEYEVMKNWRMLYHSMRRFHNLYLDNIIRIIVFFAATLCILAWQTGTNDSDEFIHHLQRTGAHFL
jgi:hypothetical protein